MAWISAEIEYPINECNYFHHHDFNPDLMKLMFTYDIDMIKIGHQARN